MAGNFFDEQAEQSQVKTAIVSKYFESWAKVITGYLTGRKQNDLRIAYIDLFAGPGRYKSGAKSTPVFILEQAIKLPLLRDNLVAWFNDKDPENISSLVKEIRGLPDIATLKHKPKVFNNEVGEEIVKMFEEKSADPDAFLRRSVGIQRAVAAPHQLGLEGLGLRMHLLFQL